MKRLHRQPGHPRHNHTNKNEEITRAARKNTLRRRVPKESLHVAQERGNEAHTNNKKYPVINIMTHTIVLEVALHAVHQRNSRAHLRQLSRRRKFGDHKLGHFADRTFRYLQQESACQRNTKLVNVRPSSSPQAPIR